MVSLFKVPGPVKDLFDQFPLVQYPAVKQLTPETKSEILKRNYSYSAPSSQNPSQSTTSFKLGTYNVFQTEDNTFLATDPLCLSIELYLAIKNGIKLPKLNNDHTDQSRNSLFLLSHHSSSNGYLPIYIEEDSKSHIIFTTALVLITMTISLTTCNLGALFELIGASTASIMAYILPPMCNLKMTGSTKTLKEKLPYLGCIVFGFAVMFISSTQTIINAIREKDGAHCSV